MINGINKKRISTNFKSVKVRCFSGTAIDQIYFNLIPLLRKKPTALVFMWVPTICQMKHFRLTINY